MTHATLSFRMLPVAPQPPPAFLQSAAALNIEFEPGDLEKLSQYLALLLDANTRFNLTAITDPDQAWTRHILDSLTLVPFIVAIQESSTTDGTPASPAADSACNPTSGSAGILPASDSPGIENFSGTRASPIQVIDVGSGGGLPGIPLAIVLRSAQIHFTLLEATGKKARFLQDTINQLNLKNVTVINDRAETIGQEHKSAGGRATAEAHSGDGSGGGGNSAGGHREKYDLVLARAVGRLPVLLELTVPLAKVGGHIIAMKGEKAAEEIADSKAALHLLHAHIVETTAAAGGTGTIVLIEKTRKTPRTYPRQPGEPNRVPLGG